MKQLLPFLLAAAITAQEITLVDALSKAEKSSAALLDIEQQLTSLDSTGSLYVTGANPELEVGTENLGVKEFEIVLSQELRFSAKKDPVRRQVELSKKQIRLSSEEIRRELHGDVIATYLVCSQLQEEAELIDSVIASVKKENEKIAHRISVGAASELELLEQQGLLIDLREEAFTIQSELRASMAKLNSYFVQEQNGSVQNIEVVSDYFTKINEEFVPNSHPAIIELQLEKDEADLLRLESKASRTPDFSISGGYKRENEAKENSLLLGFSMGLPFNKESKIAEIEADIAETSIALRKAELIRTLSAELSELKELRIQSTERLRILRDERKPLAEKMVALAKTQYIRGILPVTEKIRYKRDLISLQREELALIHDELLARASLAIFTGTLQK